MQETDHGARRFTPAVLRGFMTRLTEPSVTCTLQVSDGFNERVALFSGGGVRLLSVGERRGPDVASYLLESGKIDGSLNVPLLLLRKNLGKLKPDAIYVTACDGGKRSELASYLLLEHGFSAYVLRQDTPVSSPAQSNGES